MSRGTLKKFEKGLFFMTPKELLYVEDSLNMESQLATKCNDYSTKVQDQNLKKTLTDLANQHTQHYNMLLSNLGKWEG